MMDQVILERICSHLTIKDIESFREAIPLVHDLIDGRDIVFQANTPGSAVFKDLASQSDAKMMTKVLELSISHNVLFHINAHDDHNPPILYQAIANRQWTYAKSLLDMGADPTIRVRVRQDNETITTTPLGSALQSFTKTPNTYNPWFIFKYILEKTPYNHLRYFTLDSQNTIYTVYDHITNQTHAKDLRDLLLILPLDTVRYLITKGLSLTHKGGDGVTMIDFLTAKVRDISREYEECRSIYLQLGEDNTIHNSHVAHLQQILDNDTTISRPQRKLVEQQMNNEWMMYLAKRKREWELIDMMRDLTMEKNEIEIKIAFVQASLSTLKLSQDVSS